MGIVVANIFARSFLGSPISGTYDYVSILTSVAIGLALAHCAVQKGHIAVDFFVEKLSAPVQKIIDTITGLLSVVFLLIASWQLVLYGEGMRITGQTSPSAMIPYYPFVYLVALGVFMLAIVILLQVCNLMRKGVKK
jgi:TRAP-type C4-dicarboxylate transport system permease small subunit